ncbi:4Fe-4S binding protein [Aestuariirhabdus sp. LZHN29]|uniref:4Fe-4S binding protein n=1 Tax=Aestuariirhabdus sp. LZHN29 TaxID=3417462 RepID=UPI003CEB1A22
MSLSITERCVNCYACIDLCPSNAITQGTTQFHIDPLGCTECAGHYADPQCASICPVEGALLDGSGQEIHPPGSLTAIPPTIRVTAMDGQPSNTALT